MSEASEITKPSKAIGYATLRIYDLFILLLERKNFDKNS